MVSTIASMTKSSTHKQHHTDQEVENEQEQQQLDRLRMLFHNLNVSMPPTKEILPEAVSISSLSSSSSSSETSNRRSPSSCWVNRKEADGTTMTNLSRSKMIMMKNGLRNDHHDNDDAAAVATRPTLCHHKYSHQQRLVLRTAEMDEASSITDMPISWLFEEEDELEEHDVAAAEEEGATPFIFSSSSSSCSKDNSPQPWKKNAVLFEEEEDSDDDNEDQHNHKRNQLLIGEDELSSISHCTNPGYCFSTTTSTTTTTSDDSSFSSTLSTSFEALMQQDQVDQICLHTQRMQRCVENHLVARQEECITFCKTMALDKDHVIEEALLLQQDDDDDDDDDEIRDKVEEQQEQTQQQESLQQDGTLDPTSSSTKLVCLPDTATIIPPRTQSQSRRSVKSKAPPQEGRATWFHMSSTDKTLFLFVLLVWTMAAFFIWWTSPTTTHEGGKNVGRSEIDEPGPQVLNEDGNMSILMLFKL